MEIDKSIGIFSYGRTGSQRVPNKMLRNFANTTLLDILIDKLAAFNDQSFFGGYEQVFKEKCNRKNVQFIQRSEKSTQIDGPITECISFIKETNYKYLLLVNGCLPHLKVSTIKRFLTFVKENHFKPATVITKKNNYFFNKEKLPTNFSLSLKTLNTKKTEPIYEFSNALYFFDKEYFFKNGRYWDWEEVNFFEVSSKIELLDVDTEDDFKIAEALWGI